MCPPIHLLLDFNSSPALTCGTHPCNCPSYPLAHLLNSHKKKEKTIRPESSCLPNSSRPLPNTPPPPAQYAAAGTGAVAGEVRPTSLRPDPLGPLPSAAQSGPPGPLALCAREAGAGGHRPGHRGAWRDLSPRGAWRARRLRPAPRGAWRPASQAADASDSLPS